MSNIADEYPLFKNYRMSRTAEAFHADRSPIRGLLGPVGCGKTIACAKEFFAQMTRQERGPDGRRRTRFAVIRSTYSELKTTTIPSWLTVFPEEICGPLYKDKPFIQKIQMGDIVSEVIFLSMDNDGDLSKIKSLEVSGTFINEARYIPESFLVHLLQRSKRYPEKSYVRQTQSGVIFDTNPPSMDHWIYDAFEVKQYSTHRLFKYPPPVVKNQMGNWVANAEADYLNFLNDGVDYYLDQIRATSDKNFINTEILGNYGESLRGRPVYPNFNPDLHVSNTVEANKYVPIRISFDFGYSAAAIIYQILPSNQMIVLDEVFVEYGLFTDFIENHLLPRLSRDYDDIELGKVVGDPAGMAGSSLSKDGKNYFAILQGYGFDASPVSTNKIQIRIESVGRRLSRLVSGEPALVIHSQCKTLIKGFVGAYCYEKMKVLYDQTIYKPEPIKDYYSHLQDTVQYGCLDADNFGDLTYTSGSSRTAEIRKKLGY